MKPKPITLILVAITLIIVLSMRVTTEAFCAFGAIGDCNTTVTTKIEDITNHLSSIDNSIKQVIDQSCNLNQSASNILNFIGSTVRNTTIDQKNVIKNMCALKSIFNSSIDQTKKDRVASVIASHAKATGTLLGGGPATTDTIQKSISNSSEYLDNSLVLESVKKCISNLDLNNVVNIVGSDVSGVGINQINDFFSECLASDANTAELAQVVDKETDKRNTNDSAAQGGDVIKSVSDLISSASMVFIIIGIVIIVGLVGFVYFSSSTTQLPIFQQPLQFQMPQGQPGAPGGGPPPDFFGALKSQIPPGFLQQAQALMAQQAQAQASVPAPVG